MNAILQPRSDISDRHAEERRSLALSLFGVKAVLTAESHHPLVSERPRALGGMEKGFVLKLHDEKPDAPLSPILFRLTVPPLTPEVAERAARCMIHTYIARKIKVHGVSGVPRAGDAFAEEFARFTGSSCIPLNKGMQDGKRIIDSLKDPAHIPGMVQRVAIIEGAMTSGKSCVEAVEVLRAANFEVTDAFVLIDREQGGRQALADIGVTVHAEFTASELLDLYVETGEMTPYMRAKIGQYLVENA